MSKLRYIIFVLLCCLVLQGNASCGPMSIDSICFIKASVKIKMDKSRGDFYVAVLDSTALLKKGDFADLKKIVKYANSKCKDLNDEKLDEYLISHYQDELEDGYYRLGPDPEDYGALGVAFEDSVFASIYYKQYTHISNNIKNVKCSDANLYKYIAGSNPLTWQKSENGLVLFQDSLYYNGKDYSPFEKWFATRVRFVVYCPQDDWYYVSPSVSQPGMIVLDVPQNKGTDWDVNYCTKSVSSLCLFGALIAVLLVYIVCKLAFLLFHFSSSCFKLVFLILAIPYFLIAFHALYVWDSVIDACPGMGLLILIDFWIVVLLGIIDTFIFTFLKIDKKTDSSTDNFNTLPIGCSTRFVKFFKCLGFNFVVHFSVCVLLFLILALGFDKLADFILLLKWS